MYVMLFNRQGGKEGRVRLRYVTSILGLSEPGSLKYHRPASDIVLRVLAVQRHNKERVKFR